MNVIFSIVTAVAAPTECLERFPFRAPSSARAYFNTFDGFFNEVGNARNVDPALLKAVAYCETRLDPCAVSPVGARGVMQFMPATFNEVAPLADAHDPFEPLHSIRAAGLYLAALTNYWHGDLEAIIASYNAGPTAVARARRKGLRIPDIAETIGYVACVTRTHASLRPRSPKENEPPTVLAAFTNWFLR